MWPAKGNASNLRALVIRDLGNSKDLDVLDYKRSNGKKLLSVEFLIFFKLAQTALVPSTNSLLQACMHIALKVGRRMRECYTIRRHAFQPASFASQAEKPHVIDSAGY